MQRQCSIWQGTMRRFAVITILASGGLTNCANPQEINSDLPKPLPMALVQTWKQAGAEFCWLRPDRPVSTGDAGFGFLTVVSEQDGRSGDLPAFRFVGWQEGRLAKLPAPTQAFGLYLSEIPVTDSDLKELTGLKSLKTLFLYGTQVSDVGLRELASLNSLESLYLGRTRVTDIGLKELAALKSLRTLNLFSTAVTDAGLKDLAALERLQTLNLNVTKVTDAGLGELTGLRHLQVLHLNSTAVTD